MNFPTAINKILERVEKIQPLQYCSTRNFIDGAVTYLSPYISRGVISTKQVYESVLKRGFQPKQIEKFIQELAWRDYWQQVWIAKGELINKDLKQPQAKVSNYEMSRAIAIAKTGITAIDKELINLFETGYMHNHVRMYVASICCNIAQSHWLHPAKFMYYHLLDADWASNALSWQWVAGANSNKKYYANQENINKYCHTNQRATFLDVSYDSFENLGVPSVLQEVQKWEIKTEIPEFQSITIDENLPTLLYNFYNLDPFWNEKLECNRVLIFEPSMFENYPISKKSIEFMLNLSKNIAGIKFFVGEFSELQNKFSQTKFIYKEHPFNKNYIGIEEPREWMFNVNGYFPSFFSYWKKCKKEIQY